MIDYIIGLTHQYEEYSRGLLHCRYTSFISNNNFYNKSIQLKGLIDMVELDMDLLFSRDAFLKDLEKGVGRKVVEIEVSDLHSSPSNEDS